MGFSRAPGEIAPPACRPLERPVSAPLQFVAAIRMPDDGKSAREARPILRGVSTMPRLPKTAVALPVACLLPLIAIAAGQPAPTQPPNQPTAKDVVKAVEKKEEPKDANDPIERIKDEGQKRSQLMATLSYLTDVIGPRLTGSPNLKRANEWTRDKLSSWGLEN